MSLLSNFEQEMKRIDPTINAAEDLPIEVKVLIGEIEKEFNLVRQQIGRGGAPAHVKVPGSGG